MIRVHIFCEGQTEETFVRDLLLDHFVRLNILINPILVQTSKSGRGGVSTYGKIQRQIQIKCQEDAQSFITTMLDLYGLPKDTPGYSLLSPGLNSEEKANLIEQAIEKELQMVNFIPNLLVYEFEALLFTKPAAFASWFDSSVVVELEQERIEFKSPEDINNTKETSPSHRILRICSGYKKVLHGVEIAKEIGLETIRAECKHFDAWITRLERLGR